jgi:hypothetical protein
VQGFQLVHRTEVCASLTMGHQTQHLTLLTAGQVNVVCLQHRGVWHAPAKVRKLGFKRWNYLAKNFETVSGEVGSQVGVGQLVMSWSDYDDAILRRARTFGFDAPSRNICFALLPASTNAPVQADVLYRFLDGRFSDLLTRRVGDEAIPYFSKSTAGDTTAAAASNGLVDVDLDAPPALPTDGTTVPTHVVQLVQPPNSDQIVTLHRRRFSPAVDVQAPQLFRERDMYVNVSLSDDFDPRCAFAIRASWTICTGSVLADWDRHIRLVAPDFGFNVVRVPKAGFDALGRMDYLPTLTIDWHTVPSPRVHVVQYLCCHLSYFPERLPVVPGTRLVHQSGLVLILVTADGLTFGENPLLPTGTQTHLGLYHEFLQAARVPLAWQPPPESVVNMSATDLSGVGGFSSDTGGPPLAASP